MNHFKVLRSVKANHDCHFCGPAAQVTRFFLWVNVSLNAQRVGKKKKKEKSKESEKVKTGIY